jgi:DNA-binding NarL/FixJ family response regulator
LPAAFGGFFAAHTEFPASVYWIRAVRLKTYIVEDNPTIRENLIGTLEELACVVAVGTAETENEGKAWLIDNRQEWDLAIVDLFLKQGSGLGVLAACRDRPSRQKVVVLSNYATADIRQRCAQLGVDAVFDKSNEIDALVDYCLQQGGTIEAGTPSASP